MDHLNILCDQQVNINLYPLVDSNNIQMNHRICKKIIIFINDTTLCFFYRTIELSVDIDKTARELISLLEKASKFQDQWRQSSIIKQMITRYYRFMQLKASYPNILLIPTLDIEIIWQTHLLRPEMYREDCMRLFHRIIDHSLLTNDIEQFLKEQAFIDTCKLYEERFGEQYCPLPEAENDEQFLRNMLIQFLVH